MEDNRDFLSGLSYLHDTPENWEIFYVGGLYPNIPHKEGIDITRAFLNERSDKSISTESLYRLAKIFSKSYFQLSDQIFHQLPSIVLEQVIIFCLRNNLI